MNVVELPSLKNDKLNRIQRVFSAQGYICRPDDNQFNQYVNVVCVRADAAQEQEQAGNLPGGSPRSLGRVEYRSNGSQCNGARHLFSVSCRLPKAHAPSSLDRAYIPISPILNTID